MKSETKQSINSSILFFAILILLALMLPGCFDDDDDRPRKDTIEILVQDDDLVPLEVESED